MSQMRYGIQVQAFQILDGAQVTVWVREHSDDPMVKPEIVLRRSFTAVEMDITTPAGWARDVLVSVIEHL